VIFGAACIAAWQGRHELAARLFGAADTDLRAAMADASIQWTEPEKQLTAREHAKLRGLMGEAPFQEAFRSGTELSRTAGVELAMTLHPSDGSAGDAGDSSLRLAINSR
jgi:hypothetical protein